jgi:hypothetical protein
LCLLGYLWPSHFDKKSDETSEHTISNVQSSFKKKQSISGRIFLKKESGRKFGEEGEIVWLVVDDWC